MASPASYVHLFGIRHHGPGCARSLAAALVDLSPDCVLIEGPPEADALLPLVMEEGMTPPVALLIYVADNARRSAFYPFAAFSPEWQAIRHALQHQVPVRFMDLPVAHSLALERQEEPENPSSEAAAPAAEESTNPSLDQAADATPESEALEVDASTLVEDGADDTVRGDPLGWLGRAAGFGDGEEWWEHLVEQRHDGQDLFAAIEEAMTAVRAEAPATKDDTELRREALREAHMRKTIRAAQKEGFQRIAVVCGAWHVPALAKMPSAAFDNDLLKGLPKTKVEATWVPWTYGRLAAESGYGAGVDSPAWYEHLWLRQDASLPRWFARVGAVLREADLDCSSAHLIECVRLSEALAAMRQKPAPGLAELMEAARAIVGMGDDTALRLVRQKLIIGERLGSVPESAPTVPLQRDLLKLQKSLRLKVSPTQEALDLDLRKENDLLRSHLLHRLRLLRVPWGEVTDARSGKGTFHELWRIQWKPEFAVALIEASPWGGTVEDAAAGFARDQAARATDLPTLTTLVKEALLANLSAALTAIVHELENRAAVTGDISQLMGAVPPLAQVSRYGDVRKTDGAQVLHVLDGMLTRICIGAPNACASLDDEAASVMSRQITAVHQAVKLLEGGSHLPSWLRALTLVADGHGIHGQVAGLCARLLLDEKSEDDAVTAVSARMSRALSRGTPPESGAAWLEGFLNQSGMVLLHDDVLFRLLDDWVRSLTADHFTAILPLVRRAFALLASAERRQLGERARQHGGAAAGTSGSADAGDGTDLAWDPERARLMIPVLRQIFGLPS
ncbi:DUF5682 family protein [Verrucomicrobium spinosum]|uniref:DUF5682 family protein n=2 Tax=Verrucomicrobium spinosum TaxID=2736 RepID=UPI0001745D68|nr:DUF5682 family protein [Verrucomicrobium spinosum]